MFNCLIDDASLSQVTAAMDDAMDDKVDMVGPCPGKITKNRRLHFICAVVVRPGQQLRPVTGAPEQGQANG